MRLVKILVTILAVTSLTCAVSATEGGNSLSDAISQSQSAQTEQVETVDPGATSDTSANENTETGSTNTEESNTSDNTNSSSTSTSIGGLQTTERSDEEFIAGLNEAADLTADVEGASVVTDGAKVVAGYIVNIVSVIIIVGLTATILLDVAYISLPITRTFLSNGKTGVAAQPQAGGMGGMGSMGMRGMGGYGGMGSMGMGGMGMGSMGMGGMGMGGMNNMNGMNNAAQGNRICVISDAALNAAASESVVGPDGKTQSPLKIYAKNMIFQLIAVPVLLVLAITGVLTELGFAIASVLVDGIRMISNML